MKIIIVAVSCLLLAACADKQASDISYDSKPANFAGATSSGTAALPGSSAIAPAASAKKAITPVTIAQYGHVFLYMPLYVAIDRGFFRQEGLDVKLVSTGGDEKTFTAVSSGNAQFGVSDPIFAAIARERGQGGKVVASIVRGMPFWMVTYNKNIHKIDKPAGFAGYRIAAYTAPSTCYSVVKDLLNNKGHPVKAEIVQGAFGSLQAMLKAGQADIATEIEPVVSIAAANGAQVVFSPAHAYRNFAFTGLTVSDVFRKEHPEIIQAAVNALAKAMRYIKEDFAGALAVAKQEFPDVSEAILRSALKRLKDEGTTPDSPVLEKVAWDNAVAMRKQIGDMKGDGNFAENVDMRFAKKANELNQISQHSTQTKASISHEQ